MHVIIIGGGTGGMCLAHGLRRAGVSVAVYERYQTPTDGLHGYRLGIDPTGSRALKECLPPEVFATFVETCARAPRYFNVLTEKMRLTASIPLPDHSADDESERSASRATLRQVLFTGMDDVVHFGKVFTRYEQAPDGTVTAFFADGTTARGDILVSAEGTRSAVRRQYLPHAEVKETGITAIGTKTPLTPQTRALLPAATQQGISLIFGNRSMMGLIHVMEFAHDHTRDYINLSVWSTHDKFPVDTPFRRGADLLQVALGATGNWHPNLRALLEQSDPEAVFPVRIATSVPIEPWQPSTVTLLGDAIHTMTPGQGVGANTALRDAALLCRELTSAAAGHKSVVRAIGDYEAEMIPYGFARVVDSLDNNGTSADDAIYRPVVGRLALFGARSFFSLTSKVPAMRRKFLADLSTYRSDTAA